MRVLDVGCGAGFPLLEIAQLLGPTAKVTGIDVWEEAGKRVHWKIDKQYLKNVELVIGDAGNMPFENDNFDLIVSNVGVNNFDNPPQVMNECFRVLRKKGRMAITTNITGHFKEFYEVFESVLKESGRKDLIPKLNKQEAHRGTDESVRELFENAGFSVYKILKDRFQMRFVDGTSLLNHLLVVVGFLPAWKAIIPENEVSEVFELIEEKLNKKAEWEGELKMTIPMLYVEGIK